MKSRNMQYAIVKTADLLLLEGKPKEALWKMLNAPTMVFVTMSHENVVVTADILRQMASINGVRLMTVGTGSQWKWVGLAEIESQALISTANTCLILLDLRDRCLRGLGGRVK